MVIFTDLIYDALNFLLFLKYSLDLVMKAILEICRNTLPLFILLVLTIFRHKVKMLNYFLNLSEYI